ncbi:nicotinate (nicotinamide) nucleotide adenylyltransferase [Bythopirellula polymerisocia]|uniref:Probable nicotinate-nucleotide adenylyltransferase n=1 Tax=Bythopirellula polymerisocia TaxID=2528003 RepID=A0A5C6CGE7_9BACT|nr:nicotinate (nicotinamide) nucleotide adenylyltransferase [Bythopirellula polymerisocia]TWU22634.1 Nicotinate-nucleotide adenylyltransferase [Bythopirellula polymerisocia]
MKIGLFGGSFDPVHRAHLALANSCREQAQLDRVWFVPTAHQPFKPGGPFASNADRLAMLEIALAECMNCEICTHEIERGGMSYTIDTLTHLKDTHPESEWFLLLGADSLADFPFWRRPADICRLATPLVVNRAGEPAPNFGHLSEIVSPSRLAEIESLEVKMPPLAISSTSIREAIAQGKEWQSQVPETVAEYIREHGLYLGEAGA